MTVVTTRPVEVAAPVLYQRQLRSGFFTIAVANGLIAAWSLLILATTSVTWGLAGIGVAVAIAAADAAFFTPTQLEIEPSAVTLGYWNRTKRFDPKAVVVTHDVPRGRLSMGRRGRHRRSLMHFRDHDAHEAVHAFVTAGVEIISR